MIKLKFLFSFTVLSVFCFKFCIGDSVQCPTIKTRRQWGGAQATEILYQILPVKYVIVHHTAGDRCSTFQSCSDQVKNIQNYHMNTLGWSDIGYNFLIGDDGYIYEGVGWHKIGAHALGWNSKSIGIAFMGNFDNQLPLEQALNAAKSLLECGVQKGELDKRFRLLAARQIMSTVDPGLILYNEIQNWDNWSENTS